MIRRLFPAEVAAVTHQPGDWDGELLPEERNAVRRAVPKRVREFTCGRVCARRALFQLGIQDFPIVVGPQRAPVWPWGISGSISHCDDWCGSVAVRVGEIVGLGFDVDSAQALDPELAPLVCTPTELEAAARSRDAWGRIDPMKLLFSAKESVFKACYPLRLEMLEFQDVHVDFDRCAGTFKAHRVGDESPLAGGRVLRGRFATDASHVFTGVCVMR